ncbi:MAG: hypothetical protein V9E89_19395 [Ilumatobacteraceae bacterium]
MLMVTDPPYGVDYDPRLARTRTGRAPDGPRRSGQGAESTTGADWREAWALFPGDVAYVWHGALHADHAWPRACMAKPVFAIRSQIIWAKERLVL